MRKARALVKIPDAYFEPKDFLSVTPDEVEEAFVRANPGLTRDAIAVTCDSRRLGEVRICIGKDLRFRACPEIDARACRRDKVVMPPVRAGSAARWRKPRTSRTSAGSGNADQPCVGGGAARSYRGDFRDELSPRLSRRQFRRCRQARGDGAHSRSSAHQAGGLPRLDTHAGAGLYDLAGAEASRSGEWRDGIGRLLAAPIAADARSLLAPYLDAVAAFNGAGGISVYPGSPALVQAFLRPQDRLIACELEPSAASALARQLAGDRRSKAVAIDGWTALNAYVPPKERRGLVLIDPPFEDAGDFPRLARMLQPRTASGRPASTSRGIRSRSDRRRRRWREPCRRRHRQGPACRVERRGVAIAQRRDPGARSDRFQRSPPAA